MTALGGPLAPSPQNCDCWELNLRCAGSVCERARLAGEAKRQELLGARTRGAGLAQRDAPPLHEGARGPGDRRRGGGVSAVPLSVPTPRQAAPRLPGSARGPRPLAERPLAHG